MIDFAAFKFYPVVLLPRTYEIFDFSKGYDAERTRKTVYGIGKYNEKRAQMYTADLFANGKAQRDIHVGIDIAAPAGTLIHAFYDGTVLLKGTNRAPGDYGPTLVTEHVLVDANGTNATLYALWGHLAETSINVLNVGAKFSAGDVIARVGVKEENGGWNPHLHFQLSWQKPTKPDLPGVVSESDREVALMTYPDPQLVLGKLY